MRDRLIALGAEVLVEGDIWMEADRLARSLSEGEDATYVSPFDHPDIWEGHSTLVEEVNTSKSCKSVLLSNSFFPLTVHLCQNLSGPLDQRRSQRDCPRCNFRLCRRWWTSAWCASRHRKSGLDACPHTCCGDRRYVTSLLSLQNKNRSIDDATCRRHPSQLVTWRRC